MKYNECRINHANISRTLVGPPLHFPAIKFTATNHKLIFNYSIFDFLQCFETSNYKRHLICLMSLICISDKETTEKPSKLEYLEYLLVKTYQKPLQWEFCASPSNIITVSDYEGRWLLRKLRSLNYLMFTFRLFHFESRVLIYFTKIQWHFSTYNPVSVILS